MENFIFCTVCSKEKMDFNKTHKLRKKGSYLESFWSVFPVFGLNTEIRRVNLVFSSNARKNVPEKLQIRTFFIQWHQGPTQISKKKHFIENISILIFVRFLVPPLFVRKNINQIHFFSHWVTKCLLWVSMRIYLSRIQNPINI